MLACNSVVVGLAITVLPLSVGILLPSISSRIKHGKVPR